MRRLPALLLAATLAAAPASAAAGSSHAPAPSSSTVEHFEWSTSTGRLGVTVMSLTPELRQVYGAPKDRGVLVSHVEPGTPAAAAGIVVGDVITNVRGRAIDSPYDLFVAIGDLGKGQHVTLDLVRAGTIRTIDATLADDGQLPAVLWSTSPWLREWMLPFALSPSDGGEWFRDFWEPSEPRPPEMPSWLCKLRELAFPSRPDLVCRHA